MSVIFGLAWGSCALAQSREGRALWVVRDALISQQGISDMVKRASQGGMDRIFVQVCGRGDAYYPSRLLPRAEALLGADQTFDPLDEVIRQAHQHSLQVHVWINVLYVWSEAGPPREANHVANLHQEWIDYTVDDRSLSSYERPNPYDVEGLFLSPALLAVRSWVRNVVREIITGYDVDGVHLDYIRHAGAGTGFHPQARADFLALQHCDPLDLFRASGRDTEGEEGRRLRELWTAWRCEQVTETVREIRRCIQAERPTVKLSAAVKPDHERAVEDYGQDWKAWIEEGLVDFVAVMTYSSRTDVVARQIEEARRLAGPGTLYAGLAMFKQPADSTARQIALVRKLGADGIALFSYNSVAADPGYLDIIRRKCFEPANTAPAPLRTEEH